jgi:SAM-dependent methyltransferase
MASVAHNVMRFFRGSSTTSEQSPRQSSAAKLTRRSSGMGEISRTLPAQEGLCVLDLGATSPNNIRYFTDRGHKPYSEDVLLSSIDSSLIIKDEQGNAAVDERRFLAENLVYPAALFDVIFCWNLPDYLDESLVKPVVARLWSILKPGGLLLAFFHTKDAGPDAPCYRYHILNNDMLEMQHIVAHTAVGRGPAGGKTNFRLQRVFNNRHIENLFRDFASIKFFLARDNVREVMVVR